MAKSIEEKMEDWAKDLFKKNKTKFFTKTEKINSEIEKALSDAPSKSGGTGENKPDIKLFVESSSMRKYPVMIEVKGTKGKLVKLNSNGEIDNIKKDGTPNWQNIMNFAVNGAIHYASSIINFSSYEEVIAVGINGYDDSTGATVNEVEIYYVSKKNYCIPKKIDSDLSILYKSNWNKLDDVINELKLTEEEKEKIAKNNENIIESNLKDLNQLMWEDLNISTNARVKLVAGMIMAGLGVPGKVSPLIVSDLKGELGRNTNDGQVIINKIKDFLTEKEMPEEKRTMVVNDLSLVFLTRELYEPKNGESKLKTVYICVNEKIMPYTLSNKAGFLDFTGKLFNILMDWVEVPDGGDNDVVLTPRYVTDLMAKLCKVNKESYVWDYTVGTAGFLVSAMRLMLSDAETIVNIEEREKKKINIKCKQLLGIEKRPDIYLLAVLNMILMGDGTTNILQADSLTEFDGNYAQGELKGKPFPANVFLLNPPYSAPGKGFVFVEKALSRMDHGRAAILIQENAGAGNGLPYTQNILTKNKLVASIKMADIFKGKAGVQTAIYVLEIGTPHNIDDSVVFIDMSKDGFVRSNRKKATIKTNLKNVDHADERYAEIVDIVLGRVKKTDFYRDGKEVIRSTISLSGKDWTYKQHLQIDTKPTFDDFKNTIFDYLNWKVNHLNEEVTENE